MITLALNRTVKFLKHDNPFLSVMTDAVTDDRIDFGALDFMFAVQKPNPRVGRIKVLQQLKTGSNITSVDIEMVDCHDLLPGGIH